MSGRSRTSPAEVVRADEELRAHTDTVQAGAVHARKHVDHHHVEQVIERGVEHAGMERVAVEDGDSGQVETLPDGSVSIPVFEEQIVVEKRLVVRERVIIRKHTVVEEEVVEADLRRERVEIVADPEIADRVDITDLGSASAHGPHS